MSAGDMDEVGHFATADYACFGNDLAVRLKNQDDVSPIRKRWLIIDRAGRQLGVDAYELWAHGYTPLWSAHEQPRAPEVAIVDEVRYLIENRTDYLNEHAVIENITRALAGETFRPST
ncbi:hypothetical protein [Brevibacterium antiquum]|uniref:hypothetical protein n=1 Tax=Brevibacterium antiquum TaxID=234835 RepID=UPI0018E024CC|nr:hypothetical protein [Brevibacterium antiquum]